MGVDEGGFLHGAGLAIAFEGPQQQQRLRVGHPCDAEDQCEHTDERHVERDAQRDDVDAEQRERGGPGAPGEEGGESPFGADGVDEARLHGEEVFGDHHDHHGGDDEDHQRHVRDVGVVYGPEHDAEDDDGRKRGEDDPGDDGLLEFALEPFQVFLDEGYVIVLVVGEHRRIERGAGGADGDDGDHGDQVDQVQPGEAQQGVHEAPERCVDVEVHKSSLIYLPNTADIIVPQTRDTPYLSFYK